MQNNKIIFGLKVRQLRTELNLSYAILAEQTGMSVSYLNEIEKGKKYPKEDKINALAQALKVSPEALTSVEMPKSLAPVEELLQSNFLNELPLDLFGIELTKVVEIIANAPMRVGAFISTLLELSRNYAVREENFYFAALRSYMELHNNYFEDIEMEVKRFVKAHKIPTGHALPPHFLAGLLEKKFGYAIIENGLEAYPELKNIRAVFVPQKKKLLLNKNMNDIQRGFQLGKELGFNVLGLKERAYTSALLRVKTFDEALNHFKAGYFSAALLMNLDAFKRDMEVFLKKDLWDDGLFLKNLLQQYQATPEMLFQRMTNVLPRFLGIQNMFFLRTIHQVGTDKFDINKELHLNRRHQPHSNGLDEHYCRRWISVTLLQDLQKVRATESLPIQSVEGGSEPILVGIQRSRYFRTDDEYLCISMARAAGERNVSVTVGFLINAELKHKVRFVNDPTIQAREVSTTCERCGISQCAERAAEPVVIQKREQRQRINEALKNILSHNEDN